MTSRDTVLVVDDVPGTLGLLNEALESAGYTVLLAQSAPFALSIIGRIVPDIILIDAIMPGMDGFELCRIMKRNAALAAVPIIFMTGLTETEHVVRGFEAGGVDYVTKPVAPNEVIARIGVHLMNARRTRSARMALDAAGRFLIAAAPDGRVLWSTPQAAEQLRGAAAPEEALRVWDADWRVSPADLVPGRCVATLTQEQHTLELHFVGQFGPDEMLLRVVTAQAASGETLLRQRLGLTAREAEVLLWLSRGKSNRDISDILGMKPGTVTKHLEQIYIKLGVENRASAASIAVRVATAE